MILFENDMRHFSFGLEAHFIVSCSNPLTHICTPESTADDLVSTL